MESLTYKWSFPVTPHRVQQKGPLTHKRELTLETRQVWQGIPDQEIPQIREPQIHSTSSQQDCYLLLIAAKGEAASILQTDMLCRKRSYTESPAEAVALEVAVKRCASCPETCKPATTLRRYREQRRLLAGLLWHKKPRKAAGRWSSCEDVCLVPKNEGDIAGSQISSNLLYRPPENRSPPRSPSAESCTPRNRANTPPTLPRPTTPQIQAAEMKSGEATGHPVPTVRDPGLMERLTNQDCARWRRKESKFVNTQPLYQDYCEFHTKSAPGQTPTILSGDMSLAFAAVVSSALLAQDSSHVGPRRYASSLWQDLPEVKKEGIAGVLSPQQRQLQEAIFEVVTSEASYQRSLSVAVHHFQKSPKLSECLRASDKHTLFSNLPNVQDVSERFLLDLEEGLEQDIFLGDIGDRVLRHCPGFHKVYVPYVTNQMYQEKLMQKLLREHGKFLSVLQKLEEQPVCKRQPLKSFLVLPFQRITRLKILLENILKLAPSDSTLASSVRNAASAVGQIVSQCNDGVRSMMQTEELVLLEKQMDFNSTKSVPLISSGRVLIQHGQLQQICFQDWGMGHRPHLASKPVYLHLFSDLLLLSSRSESGRFLVTDYARRGQVKADYVKAKALGLPGLVFLLRLTPNHSGLSCEIVLQAANEDQREHWISQITRHMSQEISC